MSRLLKLFSVLVVLLNSHLLITSSDDSYCFSSFIQCQNGEMIYYPFHSGYSEYMGKHYCGYPGLSASCSEGGRPIITMSNHSSYYQYTVGDIILRLADIDTADQICPKPRHNFSFEGAVASSLRTYEDSTRITYFYNCTTLPKDVEPNLPCIDQNNNNATGRSFALPDSSIPDGFNWFDNCQEKVTTTMFDFQSKVLYTDAMKSGIPLRVQLSEDCKICEDSGGLCSFNKNFFSRCVCYHKTNDEKLFHKKCPTKGRHSKKGHPNIELMFGLFAGIVGSLLILFLLYRRICSETKPTNVEIFLESYGAHALKRYKYSDIKKMTSSFKQRLGQGGFGYVYKGKLYDGRMIAVKLLNESKGYGEEFMNEVATIGKTNHINVVTLLGFCIERTKRALIYEFMVNGSLEKFIYKKRSSSATYSRALGWEKLYQIALGIARGLEYLHRGCNNRILHFDIKPHNILLDSEFIPKISDFGLAKLSQTRDSVVSMVGTRGTNGYIAPELYCRNFGVCHISQMFIVME